MHSIILVTFGALATTAMAQMSATFDNMTWPMVTVGQMWAIEWTVGNGQPVSLTLGNNSWSTPIFTNLPATPSMYEWTITVPSDFMAGNYTLSLSQTGAGTDYSPMFEIMYGASPTMTMTSMANASAIMTTDPSVMTVTYWDTDCGCHMTSMAAPAAATGTGMMATPYTYFDETCGCTKTAMAPAPTTANCGGNGCSNYTIPPPTPMSTMAPAAPPMSSSLATTYSGGANKLSNSIFGIIVLGAISLLI